MERQERRGTGQLWLSESSESGSYGEWAIRRTEWEWMGVGKSGLLDDEGQGDFALADESEREAEQRERQRGEGGEEEDRRLGRLCLGWVDSGWTVSGRMVVLGFAGLCWGKAAYTARRGSGLTRFSTSMALLVAVQRAGASRGVSSLEQCSEQCRPGS